MAEGDQALDILIAGGTLLTMAAPDEVIENPWIGIRDGRILFVEAAPSPPFPLPEAREVIDASGHLIMPGLVNAHTHLPMVLFRGLADDLPLMNWLNDYIFPAEARFITPQTVQAASVLAIAEMIQSGTTTFCDGYFYEDTIAAAAIDCGMRGVVAQGFIDFPTPDQPDPSQNREKAERFIARWRGRSPLITPSLVCHSPYTCSSETLRAIKDVSRRTGTSFQIHLAETREEVALLQERYRKKPAFHLRDLGLLDERTIAAHCIWLGEEEIDLLASHHVKVAHDPESNMKLGAGVAPVAAMLRRGIDVGLGTDGCASNNNLDLFGEMGMCSKLQKVSSGDPTALPAATVVEMATMGGARVLGLASEIGSVVPGKWADIILLAMNKPHLTPLYNPFSQVVYAAAGSDVATVLIGGRVVMRNRRLLTLDVEGAMAAVRRIAASIPRSVIFRNPEEGVLP
jgi:5-methylthioadenosine/S-adenosylhomocysteine deaminase